MSAVLAQPPVAGLTPEDIVREVKTLPSAPKVLPRLKRLLMDGNSSIHEIVALVRLDPGIAVRVLQVSNSAYFSKGVRCATVEEAVNRIGYDQIYELVSYAVASQVLVRPLEIYGFEIDELWTMSVSCALAAETIAECTGRDRSVAYTVGLLHCVGMAALDEWALHSGQRFSLTWTGFPREAVESERSRLGFTQAETGAALLRDWEFSPAMSEPVRLQYTPRASAVHGQMASLLYAAKWVRSMLCARDPLERPALPNPVHLQPLGLAPAVLNAIVPDVTRKLSAVSSLLDSNQRPAAPERHRFPTQSWR